MSVQTSKNGAEERVTFAIVGNLDVNAVRSFANEIEALPSSHQRILLDLSQTDAGDAAGLSELVALLQRVRPRFGAVNLILNQSSDFPLDAIFGVTGDDASSRERRKAVGTLVRSPKWRQGLSDSAMDPQVILRPVHGSGGLTVDFRYSDVNRAASDYLGMTQEALEGATVSELFPGSTSAALIETFATAIASGQLLVLDDMGFPTPTPEGPVYFDIRGVPIDGALGLTWRDVTDRHRQAAQLSESARQLQAINDSALEPHVVLEAVRDDTDTIVDFVYTEANDAACAYNRIPREQLLGMRLLKLLPSHVGNDLFAQYVHAVNAGEPLVLNDYSFSNDLFPDDRWYDIRAVKVGDSLSYTWRDVTDQHLAAADLAESERAYRLLAENATGAVFRVNAEGRITWASGSVGALLGWNPADLTGRDALEFIHLDDRPGTLAAIAAAEDAGTNEIASPGEQEARVQNRDGTWRWVAVSVHGHNVDGRPGYLIALHDINQRVSVRKELDRVMGHDHLTGLANLSTFTARIDNLIHRARADNTELAVLCIGIDALGWANEALGHGGGDSLIAAIAGRFVQAIGNPDLVGRGVAGDFFAAIPKSALALTDVADYFLSIVRDPVTIKGQPVSATASLGITVLRPGASAGALVHEATLAMHQAKHNGQDRTEFFSPEMEQAVRSRLSTEESIRQGLGNGEFKAWYMPLISLETGAVTGYEALARRIRPGRRQSEPADFMAVAEQAGLISDIDFVVLQQVLSAFQVLPVDVSVAVNLSGRTLGRADFLPKVTGAILDSGIDPNRLHLEVTETALLRPPPELAREMTAIADLGVQWYVDDFGTGYSSLSHLRDLPIAGVKLDRSFTAGLFSRDAKNARLAMGLAGLAAALEMDTVAEGVETREQAAILASQGWRKGQGYLYGKPAPLPTV